MAAFAVPKFGNWQHNFRLKSATQELFANFQRTKIMAVKENANCAITFDDTDGEITGYTVYIDLNKNFIHDSGENIIGKVNWERDYDKSVKNSGINFPDGGDGPSVAFRPNGLPVKPGAGGGTITGNGSVSLKNMNDTRETSVIVSVAGNIRIKRIK